MAILAQVLNFIMAMILFINAPPNEGMTPDEQVFKVWLMLEILMVVSLVVTNVLYTFGRSFERNKLSLSIDDTTDLNVDFLASETTQLAIATYTLPSWPIFCNIWLLFYFANIEEKYGDVIPKEKSLKIDQVVSVQMIMQLVQVLLTMYAFLIPINPADSFTIISKKYLRLLRKYNKYIVYGCTITYSIVIPVISMAYWLIEWNINTDPENLVRAWVIVYPISGICQIIYYFWLLQDAIK